MTIEKLESKLIRWAKNAPESLRKALLLAAEGVRREVQERHLMGPKMPRGVGHPTGATLDRKTHRLFKSIAIRAEVAREEVRATVGTNVTNRGYSYPRAHEYGLGKMPERPFLRPSVHKRRPETLRIVEKAFMEEYKRA